MGSQAVDPSAVHIDDPARASHYPYSYHLPNAAFDQLRHHLPAPLSAQTHPDAKSWAQPTFMPAFSHSYLNGQDATYAFPHGAIPYYPSFCDLEQTFNGEDLEVGSTSGEDDVEGLGE